MLFLVLEKFMEKIKATKEDNDKYLPLLVKEITDYAIFAMTTEGFISTWNEGAELIKGYKKEEIIGKHYRILFPEEAQKEGTPEKHLQIAKEEGRYEERNWRRKKSGELFWARIVLMPLYDDNKKLLGFAKITQDLTTERVIEIAKRDFSNFVSHELRTPVTNIKAYAALIEKCLKENRECDIEKYLAKTQSVIERLTGLVNELHESNKAETGKIQIEKKEFNFEELIDDNLETISVTYPNQKIEKEGGADIMINADPYKISQVFLNYITNAIKYSSGKEIKVILKSDKEEVMVSVVDKGKGLTKEQMKHMFSKYYRVETSSKIEGLGVGLYLSKKIINVHNGRVGVESEEGRGSTFYFSLPIP